MSESEAPVMTIDMDALGAAIDALDQQEVTAPAVGDAVITWHDDEVMRYLGPDPHGSVHTVVIDGRTPSGAYAPLGHVAPADTPITDRFDHLISVVKGKGPSWLGNWRLILPGHEHGSWHKTKKAAVAAGRRRMAIVQWHADHPTT